MAPFVYTGAGKRGSPHLTEAQSKCVKHACAIQKCLSLHGSKQGPCQEAVEMWRSCVEKQEERLARIAEAGKGGGG